MKAVKSLLVAGSLMLVAGAALADGESIYNSGCAACHATGVAGAPKTGDTAAWAGRVTQDIDTMYDHAINGYQGESGVMPPKGGFMNLSDDDVKLVVDYMVEASK
jgi:cytochrome c5